MSTQTNWIALSVQPPADGQHVWVMSQFGLLRRVTYRAAPAPHWVDRSEAVGLSLYPRWRPVMVGAVPGQDML